MSGIVQNISQTLTPEAAQNEQQEYHLQDLVLFPLNTLPQQYELSLSHPLHFFCDTTTLGILVDVWNKFRGKL